jgi:hypothetical protein
LLNGDPGNPPGQERISYGLVVVAGCVAGWVAGCVAGWVAGCVAGCVAGWVAGCVAGGWVVACCVAAGWVVAGGWLVEGDGDCTAGETAVGVADWETAAPFCEGRAGGELSVLPVWVGGFVCETGEPPMTLGTTMAAATTAASSPAASNAHAKPRRFLRGGWPSAPGGGARNAAPVGVRSGWPSAPEGWARNAASVGVWRGAALVLVGGPLVLPVGGRA